MNNPADPYLYPGTSILINKLGLRDQSKLTQLEMTFSYVRLHELLENPQLGKFDYPHLQEIHHHIFKDIYDFAGVPRTIGMSKREAVIDGHSVAYPRPHDPFVPNNLAQRAKYAFDQLKKDNFLVGLEKQQFVEQLVKHATEIWEVHPFLEGNTRTVVEFVRQLGKNACYEITSVLTKEPRLLRDAFVLCYSGNQKPLKALFDQAVINITQIDKTGSAVGRHNLRLVKKSR